MSKARKASTANGNDPRQKLSGDFVTALQADWPRARIPHALTTEGAFQRERFAVVHAGRGETLLGGVGADNQILAASVAQTLRCELPVTAVSDIEMRLWRKLAVNSVINPLTALHGCRNGELLQLPDIERRVAQLCAELCAFAAAAGQSLDAAELSRQVFAVMRSTAANRSSMLQDIEQRRGTEIDFINGYIVRRGHELGVPCPGHAALWRAIKEREADHPTT